MPKNYNRLLHEKSPYLLQHKDNPVHWYAWGPEAFEAAKEQNKPIFLSIGYSTCHWCHVMEHDSFERQEVADLMNEHFINIKVDREERPDVDEIYMAAVHAMGQRGGWPLSLFLTPELKPFFGGTYWPRQNFMNLLEKLAKLWREEREKIEESAASLLEHLKTQKSSSTSSQRRLGSRDDQAPLDPSLRWDDSDGKKVFRDFYRTSKENFDPEWGGFGAAPKFPHTMQLSTLLRIHRRTQDADALEMVKVSLDKMARGGIYDHLGGGFARYSTDERWLIPHFEKMLYDNALLVKTYLEAYQVTKQEMFCSVAKETLDYVLREMSHDEGGYYSAEDADSEGVEGKFYVWSLDEIQKALTPEEAHLLIDVYGVTPQGNFEHGSTNLSLQAKFTWDDKQNSQLQSAHQKLFQIREARIHPHKGDKILTSWNGLMISAMALGYQVLKDQRYLESAHAAVGFIKKSLYPEQKLLARYRDGEGRFAAYLDDYAYLIQGLLDLYECDFDPQILKWAVELQHQQKNLFWDDPNGGFFFTDGSDPSLLIRSKEGMDGALPNGNAISALNLLRLHDLTLEAELKEDALKIFRCFSNLISEYPHAFGQMLIAYDYLNDSSKEIGILARKGDPTAEKFLDRLRESFCPNKAIAWAEAGEDFPALVKDKACLENQATFYICQDQSCQKPTQDEEEALKLVLECRRYAL